MNSEEKTEKIIEEMVPVFAPLVPMKEKEDELQCIISDDKLLGLYDEIIDNLRDDRKEIDDVLKDMIEMVINQGDASAPSKEALVNLMKIKSDTADKMAKVADLMTRLKMKEKDTFPRYLAAHQENNTININDKSQKRKFLKEIQRKLKESTND